MNKVYLLTGSNMGSRSSNVEAAAKSIESHCGKITKFSPVYQTAAWGFADQPAFLNQALELLSSLSAHELLNTLLSIEKDLGRIRLEKFGPRVIDIDILLYNDEIYQDSNLIIPHPELQNRRFALTPLSIIAPGLIHPQLKKTISELLAACSDPLPVEKF